MSGLTFGQKNGNVDLLDWDTAIVEGFGAQLDIIKKQYYLPLNIFDEVNDEKVDKVLVIFKRPEPTDANFVLPAIVVTRDNVAPAYNRLTSPTVQYRIPAPGATMVSAGGQIGWTEYETKPQEQPYDISYTIECWGRYRQEAQTLLMMVMVAYPLQTGTVTVTDSEGVQRQYTVFQQGTADLTQISSMVDRIPGFSLSIKCEAELTLDRTSFTVSAFTGSLSSSPIPEISDAGNSGPDGSGFGDTENGGNGPNPGPGGLYGTGLPIIRAGIVEDLV